MRRPSRSGLPWMFVLWASIPLTAQNLESIGREKPVSINGGVSFNQIFYASDGIASRRDPYSYFASGNLNFSLYGWNVPLTFSVSNHNASFSQPFNQYSVHPTWKWIRVHAGYTSMSFSPYTVNGHIFAGAGIDMTPEGKWKVSALYGRFLKAIEADTTARNLPAFQRMGYAFKANYGAGSNTLDIILFHAEDNKNSIRMPADSLQITPQENLVVSVGGSMAFLKNFIVRGELAASAITRDVRAGEVTNDHLLARSTALFQPRLTSAYYQALKSSLDYQSNGWLFGIGYERIDPGYRTLGAYYFNNDLENFTLNTSGGFREGKLTLAVSTGVQHDNVDKTKISTMRRLVSSLNIGYMPSPRLNISGAWSSFGTYTNIRPQFETLNQLTPYDNLDTLNFTQISRNASFSAMYSLRSPENKKQNVNLNISWQKAADSQGGTQQHFGTRFYNISAGYSINLTSQNTGLAVTLNTTINEGSEMNTRMMGPTASITRSFFNRKFRTTFSSSWNQTYNNGTNTSSLINGRLNSVVSIRNKHNVNISAVLVGRTLRENRSVTEFTATIGYNYSFGTNRNKP